MKFLLTFFLALLTAMPTPAMATIAHLQNEDFRTDTQIIANGGAANQLLNDVKIWVTANGINSKLSDAITNGVIGGGGGSVGVELLTNPGFESGGVTNGWTSTGGTVVTVTSGAHLMFGSKTAQWTASASSQHFKSTPAAPIRALAGTNCSATIYYHYPAGANGDYTFQVVNDSAAVVASQSLNVSATSIPVTLTFPCGTLTTSTLYWDLVSNVASPSAIYFDGNHLGSLGLYVFGSQLPPTRTVLTTGSGTYTTPAGVQYLRVRMVGPGGGGGHSSNGAGDGANGNVSANDTVFGNLTAGKGQAGPGSSSGSTNGGAGGSATVGVGWTQVLALVGGQGGASAEYDVNATTAANTIVRPQGGKGGSTPWAGGTQASAGSTASVAPNSGEGGSGGGYAASGTDGNARTGGGGGGGGYVEAITQPSPSQTFAYTVAAGGIGGTTGTGAGSVLGSTGAAGQIVVDEYYAPTQNTAYKPDFIPPAPTVQRFTSGGPLTYTRPTNPTPTYIRVRMIGGGGGGAGSGSAGAGSGTNGGASSFDTLTAGGGTGALGGNANGGDGGTATVSGGWVGFGTNGNGGWGTTAIPSATALSGTVGGVGPFGGTARGPNLNNGAGAGAANSGAGGNGGGSGSATSGNNGASGGSGAYVEATISNPNPTYTYTVGAGGSGGTLGTSGIAGGNGGSGVVEVTEYYGSAPAPLLVNSVVAQYSGVTRVNTVVLKSSTYTATDADETIKFTSSATLNLPAAASVPGKKYEVVASGGSTFVTIDPNASETVCGQTTIKVGAEPDSIIIQSDGTNWLGLGQGCSRTVPLAVGFAGACVSSAPMFGAVASSAGTAPDCTITLVSGLFSATPTCTCTSSQSFVVAGNGIALCSGLASTATATQWHQAFISTATPPVNSPYTGAGAQAQCQGPR